TPPLTGLPTVPWTPQTQASGAAKPALGSRRLALSRWLSPAERQASFQASFQANFQASPFGSQAAAEVPRGRAYTPAQTASGSRKQPVGAAGGVLRLCFVPRLRFVPRPDWLLGVRTSSFCWRRHPCVRLSNP